MTVQADSIQQALVHLASEFEEVRHLLASAVDELTTPLGELVRGQLQRSLLPHRAGLILAAGVGAFPSARLREQRILVAAAAEMLYLALGIHQLLLTGIAAEEKESPEKSWIGSVTLAGDYCFSRSAILAAQTDNAQVVEAFANSLKTVSERHLRHLFHAGSLAAADHEPAQAGLTSVSILAGHDQQITRLVSNLGAQLIEPLSVPQAVDSQSYPLIDQLPDFQQVRWQALLLWQPTPYDFSHG